MERLLLRWFRSTPWILPAVFFLGACQENTSDTLAAGNPIAAPVASFSAAPTTGLVPLEVQFANRSTGTVTRVSWDFGDGSLSSERDPRHVYTSPGVFTVTLSLSGPRGESVFMAENFVVARPPAPVAGFTASTLEGVVPLTVQFTDASQGDVQVWAWDFGDGSTSDEPSPEHNFLVPGERQVTLSVTGAGGSSSLPSTAGVRARAPEPVAAFTVDTRDAVVPFTARFRNLSDAPFADGFTWTFGDGSAPLTIGTADDVVHTYAVPGPYTVTLLADGGFGAGNDLRSQPNFITARAPQPMAAFSAAPTDGVVPLRTTFRNLSTAPFGPGYLWDFGDGSAPLATTTAVDVEHVYAVPGPYSVSLLARAGFGATDDREDRPGLVLARAPNPIAFFETVPATPGGPPPLTVQFIDRSSNAVDLQWDLDGDGTVDVTGDPSPSFTYTELGSYSPSLRAIGGFGSTPSFREAPGLVEAFLPIGDGSFEVSAVGSPPGSGWVSMADGRDGGSVAVASWGSAVLGPPPAGLALGTQFCELRDSSISLTSVSQEFSLRSGTPNLGFAAQLFINEAGFSCDGANAELTVTLTDGSRTVNLLRRNMLDVTDTLPPYCHTQLEYNTFSIPSLFPNADTSTRFTFSAAMLPIRPPLGGPPSIAYIDGLQLLPSSDPPDVDFTATTSAGSCPCSGEVPLDVTFVGFSSVNDPNTTWSWDFGDFQAGSGPMVTHCYATGGTYDVSLTVRVPLRPDSTVTKAGLVRTQQRPTCFISGPSAALTNQSVSFSALVTDDSPANQLTYSWDFGDGTGASGPSTLHVYRIANLAAMPFTFPVQFGPPSYTVSLTVTDPDGLSCTTTRAIDINPATSWDRVFDGVFSGGNRCAICHTSRSDGGLGLPDKATAYVNLVNRTSGCASRLRVRPQVATESALYLRLIGTTCGDQMPSSGGFLSTSELAEVEAWISAGAPQRVN